jgi:competence protein ComEC
MARRLQWVLQFSVAIATFLALVAGLWAQPRARLFVHFIDVGQADAVLITNDQQSCTILIDAGDTRYPESAKRFRAYLASHLPSGSAIDLVIATHPHNDHIGSMQWVLDTYRVKRYVDNGQVYDSRIYERLMAVVTHQRRHDGLDYHPWPMIPAGVRTVCGVDGPQLEFPSPPAGVDSDVCDDNQNNCSVITRLTFGGSSFLFPGDAEEQEEAQLLSSASLRQRLRADVLKVPHHGSDTSSSEDFLAAVAPAWMVISAGEKDVGTNRAYKHPRFSTIQELLPFAGDRAHRRLIDAFDGALRRWRRVPIWGGLWITRVDGTVVLTTDGSHVSKAGPASRTD